VLGGVDALPGTACGVRSSKLSDCPAEVKGSFGRESIYSFNVAESWRRNAMCICVQTLEVAPPFARLKDSDVVEKNPRVIRSRLGHKRNAQQSAPKLTIPAAIARDRPACWTGLKSAENCSEEIV
jgi:hypothetical protein